MPYKGYWWNVPGRQKYWEFADWADYNNWIDYYKTESLLPGSDKWKRVRDFIDPLIETISKKRKTAAGGSVTKTDPDTKGSAKEMKVGGFSSYPSTSCCIHVPSINLKKHAKKPWRGDNKLLENPNKIVDYRSLIPASSTDRKVLRSLFDETVTVVADGTGVNSVLSHGTINIGGFNSIAQCNRMFTLLGNTEPTYEGGGTPHGVANAADGNGLVVLDNQRLDLVFKNITKNPIPGTTPQAYSTCPVYISIYVVRYKKDVYMQLATTGAAVDQITKWVGYGFGARYPDDGEEYGNTNTHDYCCSFKENVWCQEHCKVVEIRRFCIAPGQEALLSIFLNIKQCLSYKYKLNAIGGSTAYNPVIKKKGEFDIFLEMHGGWDQHGGSTGITMEAAQVGLYGAKSFVAYNYTPDDNVWQRRNATNITVGSLVDTIDVHQDGPTY